MPECGECQRLGKRNRQLKNQLITAKTKLMNCRLEIKKLKKQSEENRPGKSYAQKSCLRGKIPVTNIPFSAKCFIRYRSSTWQHCWSWWSRTKWWPWTWRDWKSTRWNNRRRARLFFWWIPWDWNPYGHCLRARRRPGYCRRQVHLIAYTLYAYTKIFFFLFHSGDF